MDLKEDLKFDRFTLDVDAEEHTQKVEKWYTLWADVFEKRQKLEGKRDMIYAIWAQAIRKDPVTYGFDPKKLTEASIKEYILLNAPEYQEVLQEIITVSHQKHVLDGAKVQFEHKKKMMEGEISLYIAGYWAKTKMSPDKRWEASSRAESEMVEELNKDVPDILVRRKTNG